MPSIALFRNRLAGYYFSHAWRRQLGRLAAALEQADPSAQQRRRVVHPAFK
jgi:hypothetical protein